MWSSSLSIIFIVHPWCSTDAYIIPFYCWIMLRCSIPYHISSIHSSVSGHLGVFRFWLSWVRLLWTFVYKFLHRPRFSVLLDVYLGVKWLGYVVPFCGTTKLFSTATQHFIFLPPIYDGSSFSTSSPTTVICFLIIAIWSVWSGILWFWSSFP